MKDYALGKYDFFPQDVKRETILFPAQAARAAVTVQDLASRLPSSLLYGLGVSNRAVLRRLLACGLPVSLYTERPLSWEERRGLPPSVTLYAEDALPSPASFSLLLRSPGVRPDAPLILAAAAEGCLVSGEWELGLALASHLSPGRVIGVTGSDGKTTTVRMLAHMLKSAGYRVSVGGNIGTPLLDAACAMAPGDFLVAELSSFQLLTLPSPPPLAAVTSFTENHLDWHRGREEYRAAKARIFGGVTTLFSSVARAFPEAAGTLRVLSEEMPLPSLPPTLPGRHNQKNAALAAAVLSELLPQEAAIASLEDFRLSKGRLTPLGTFLGVACFDSSADTTPARTLISLRAFPSLAASAGLSPRPVLLLGGRGKELPLAPLREAAPLIAGAVLTGEEGPSMKAVLSGFGLPLLLERDFSCAVRASHAMAASLSSPLLLSPAATSHDAFRDYRERSAAFRRILETM